MYINLNLLLRLSSKLSIANFSERVKKIVTDSMTLGTTLFREQNSKFITINLVNIDEISLHNT